LRPALYYFAPSGLFKSITAAHLPALPFELFPLAVSPEILLLHYRDVSIPGIGPASGRYGVVLLCMAISFFLVLLSAQSRLFLFCFAFCSRTAAGPRSVDCPRLAIGAGKKGDPRSSLASADSSVG